MFLWKCWSFAFLKLASNVEVKWLVHQICRPPFSYYFAGPKDGTLEVFNDNLPGLPDNIRPAADGKSYYVALFALRYREKPSMFDYLSTQPWLRQIAAKVCALFKSPLERSTNEKFTHKKGSFNCLLCCNVWALWIPLDEWKHFV